MRKALQMMDLWFGLSLSLGGVVAILLFTLFEVSLLVAILVAASVAFYGAFLVLQLEPDVDRVRIWRIGITANLLAFVSFWSVSFSETVLPSPEVLVFPLAVVFAVVVDYAYRPWGRRG